MNFRSVPKRLERFFRQNLIAIELTGFGVAVIAFLLEMQIITALSLTTVATIYFLFLHFDSKSTDWMQKIFEKIMPISWSIATVGIMFWALQLPGFEAQLWMGAAALGSSIIFLTYQKLISESFEAHVELIRSFLIFAVSIAIIGISQIS